MRALIVVLLVVGFVATYWWWIAVALGAVVLFVALLAGAFYWARRVDAREEERAALVARADQQHAWVLAGDDRGIYGEYPPKQIAIDAGSIAHQRLCTSEAVFGPWGL